MAFAGKIAHTHNNGTKSLTVTGSLTFMKHKTRKRRKPEIVRTADYSCAYVSKMAVLIIFPVFLQTVINLIMLSIGRQGVLLMLNVCYAIRLTGRLTVRLPR